MGRSDQPGTPPFTAVERRFRYLVFGKEKGLLCLCKECNNQIGAWYAPAFIRFSQAADALLRRPGEPPARLPAARFAEGIRPLCICKQILSMFACINGFDGRGGEEILPFRAFLLSRESNALPPGYRLFLFATASKNARYIPFTELLSARKGGPAALTVSEIVHYPFGMLLVKGAADEGAESFLQDFVEITPWADYRFETSMPVECDLPVFPCNSVYPLDFRTRDECLKGIGPRIGQGTRPVN